MPGVPYPAILKFVIPKHPVSHSGNHGCFIDTKPEEIESIAREIPDSPNIGVSLVRRILKKAIPSWTADSVGKQALQWRTLILLREESARPS